jgi:hypothetical protein
MLHTSGIFQLILDFLASPDPIFSLLSLTSSEYYGKLVSIII